MLKKFENFETKMDYNDLVNILTDIEEFDMIIDKLLWKKIVDNRITSSDELNSKNFEDLTSKNGYILICIQKRNSSLSSVSLTDLLGTFCSRIGELGWITLQYNFYKTPFKICICKKDDTLTRQKLSKIDATKN